MLVSFSIASLNAQTKVDVTKLSEKVGGTLTSPKID